MREINAKLTFNTPLKLEGACLIKERKGVAVIILELSERCETGGYFVDSDNSIALTVDFKKNGKIFDDAIELTDYKGWHIFSAWPSKYTIHLCLIDSYEEADNDRVE